MQQIFSSPEIFLTSPVRGAIESEQAWFDQQKEMTLHYSLILFNIDVFKRKKKESIEPLMCCRDLRR